MSDVPAGAGTRPPGPPAPPLDLRSPRVRRIERGFEYFSVLMGFVFIVLSVALNPLCWWFGLVSVGIQMVIVFRSRLFMDAALQFVFFVLGIFGIYYWLHGGEDGGAPSPTRLGWELGLGVGVVSLAALFALWPLMRRLKAAYPFFDTLATVLCLAAQFLQSRMVIENWLIYIVGDLICVGLYIRKRLYGYAVLLAVYTIWAGIGYFEWQGYTITQPWAGKLAEAWGWLSGSLNGGQGGAP